MANYCNQAIGGDVVKRMNLDTTFGLAELGPPENA